MKYVSEVEISRKEFDYINRLLRDIDFNDDSDEMQDIIDKLDAHKYSHPCGFWFDFDDGSHITIDIYSGSSNYYDDCLWVSSDGKEDYLFDCSYWLDEEMEFHPTDDEVPYICKFIIKED